MLILKIVIWFILFIILYRIIVGIIRKVWKFPAPAFISIFLDSKMRGWMQPPKDIIRFSKIIKGGKVLEIGSGSGFFTIPAAKMVGIEGEIVAIDIQKEMLKKISKKLGKEKNKEIKNIRLVKASAYDIPYSAETFDVAFTVSVLQEIPNPHKVLLEANRVLKVGGLISVSEFIPDPDWPLRKTVEKQLYAAGFKNLKRHGNLLRYTITGEK